MYYAMDPQGYMPQAGYWLPTQAGYGLPVQAGYGLPAQAVYGLPLQAGYGLPLQAASWMAPESALWADPPEAALGSVPSGRCVAIPNLNRGTVVTVKETDEEVITGVWSVARLRTAADGRVALTVYLPAAVTLDKVTGRCHSRPADLTVTLRGADLREVANEAARAWCRSV